MDKKLHCVRVEMYVMAENASGACVAATKAPFDIFECRARKADHVNPEWEDAIPYNADDERTCAEVLSSERALHAAASLIATRRPQSPNIRAQLMSVSSRASVH